MPKDAIHHITARGNNDLASLDRHDVLKHLDASGVILFRGFDFSLESFESFSSIFCNDFHKVGTRVTLRKRNGDGFSTEVFRSNFSLLAHSEGTYRPWPPPPELCFFYCLTPPSEAGGETTLVDGLAFYNRLPKDLRTRFMESGVIYQSHWEPARWQVEFGLESTNELRQLLNKFPEVEFRLEHENLDIRYRTDAFKPTSLGKLAFANAMLAHLPYVNHPNYQDDKVYSKSDNRVFFGDGEKITDHIVNQLIDIHDDILLAHRWQTGDLLLIDNTRFMHGRRMTIAPCERILISRFGSRGKGNSIDRYK
jgi:alpha-ketoglutarate-dependent taurine dioxygenase